MQALRIYRLQKVLVKIVEALDMKRRTLLLGSILPSFLFAGCLSDSQDENGKYDEPESVAAHFDENKPVRPECEKESETLEFDNGDETVEYETAETIPYPEPPTEFDRDTVVEYVGEFDHAYVTHNVLCDRDASDHILNVGHSVKERETFDWYDDITVVYLLQAAGASQGVDEDGVGWEAELGLSGLVYAVDETGMARAESFASEPDTDVEDEAPNLLEEAEFVASFE